MYVPPHFKEDRVPILHEAIGKIGFGTLVTTGPDGLEANHLPMLVQAAPEPFGTLRGHVARANPVWKTASAGDAALAMFLGPNAYVTPSWYPTKGETGKVVPTWNYLAVHAHGRLEFFDDREKLREIVGSLTQTHEASRAAPWAITDAPSDYIDHMLRGIVGFTLTITRLEGKWKMSQNRSAEDLAGVRNGLSQESGDAHKAVGDIMGAVKPAN